MIGPARLPRKLGGLFASGAPNGSSRCFHKGRAVVPCSVGENGETELDVTCFDR